MKLIFSLLALTSQLFAATLNEQLRILVAGADRAELMWRPDQQVALIGILPIKQVYCGPAVENLLAHLQFDKDKPAKPTPPIEPGAIVMKIPDCRCGGSHIIRFYRGTKILLEVAFLHGEKLRVSGLGEGHDCRLDEASQKWLQAEADWVRDLAIIEDFQSRKKPNQPLQPTTTAVIPAAEQPVRQP